MGRCARCERGIEAHIGRGVDHPEAVRAHHPHAAAVGSQQQFALQLDAVGADLRESGGNHHEPLDTLASAGVNRFDALGSRDGEDSEVDRTVDRLDARRACETEQLRRTSG